MFDAIVKGFNSIKNWFIEVWDTTVEWVGNFFSYALESAYGLFYSSVELILDNIPDNTIDLSTMSIYYSKMNYLFPINETLILFTAFVTFVSIFIGVKYIIKLIPTIG